MSQQYKKEWYQKHKQQILKRVKQYYWNHKDKCKTSVRKNRLRKTFGLTIDDYNKLFEVQNGCCVICGRHQSELKYRLCVDHNHLSGKIRQLLCLGCNVKIEWFLKNPIDIILYLKNHEKSLFDLMVKDIQDGKRSATIQYEPSKGGMEETKSSPQSITEVQENKDEKIGELR